MKLKYYLLFCAFFFSFFYASANENLTPIFSACEGLDPDSVYTDVNADNIIVSWGPGLTTGTYVVHYGSPGFSPADGEGDKVMVMDTTALTVEELSENTNYEYYISVDCGTEQSDTIGPIPFKTIFLTDVGISAIFAPATDCNLGQDSVKVFIKNFGQTPQTLIPFNYMVNGIDGNVSMPQDGLYTGVVSNDSVGITAFDATFNFAAPGEYTIVAWTEFEDDSQVSNDTFIQLITHIPVITSYPYLWDFELWKGGWLPSGENSSWEFGTPDNQLIDRAISGENAWVTQLTGDHNNNELSYLVSPCLDFSTISDDPLLAFALNFDSETDGDRAWVEFTIDGGETWTKVGTGETGINWYNDTDQQVWEGNAGFEGWVIAQHVLKGVVGARDARLRIVFQSNGTVTNEGFGLDNVAITPPLMNDLFARTVSHAADEDCGATQDEITLSILNNGTVEQNSFEVGYQVNDNTPVTENLTNFPVMPGERKTYIFNNTFDSTTPGVYDVKVWAKATGDINIYNDTIYLQFEIDAPQALPIEEDFEAMALPMGWTSNAASPVDNGHNNSSYVLTSLMNAGNPAFEVLTNNIGPINANDSLTFDYRFVNFPAGIQPHSLSNDSLLVEISTDCGATFTMATFINVMNHMPAVSMTNVKVDLNPYAGQNIRIRFRMLRKFGDFWFDMDNINIIGCPPNLALSPQSLSESGAGNGDGSIIISPSQGSAPYTYAWDNLAMNDTLENLTPGMYTVTVTDAIGCTDNATIEIGTCPSSLDLSFSKSNETSQGKEDGQAALSIGAGAGPYSFEWSNGGTKSFIKDVTSGFYTVTVTDVNGCSETASVTIDIASSAYQIEQLTDLRLSPNPTTGNTTLTLDFAEAVNINVQVFNVVGQQLYNLDRNQILNENILIDLSDQPSGLYLVRMTVENQMHTERLIRL